MREWTVLLDILKIFCNGSGMEISVQKSSLIYHNMEKQAMDNIRVFLPYKTTFLVEGFKYLFF